MANRWSIGVGWILLWPTLVLANDGRDRYQAHTPPTLYLFPEPSTFGKECGYTVLPHDGPGGADGDLAFRWAQAPGIALVRLAAARTFRQWGPSKNPMTIFDLSAENGDTPVAFSPGKPPRGRHPGGSHDGGINLDLGYYLTARSGTHFSPDLSACPKHFQKDSGSKSGKPSGPLDAYQCQGPPDHLDVDRQAFFFLELFRIDQDLFQGNLLEEIGIDHQISGAVLPRIRRWALESKYGATLEMYTRMKQVFTADRFEGWAHSHHHHCHLRLQNLERNGPYRKAIDTLLEQEQTLDAGLLEAKQRQPGPVLRTRLMSYQLNRAIEMELIDTEQLKGVRFRAGTSTWNEPDPDSLPRYRAVVDIPSGPQKKSKQIEAVAEWNTSTGIQRISTTLRLPRQEPYLFVTVNPDQFRGSYIRQSERWTFQLEIPESQRIYVTGVTYQIDRNQPSDARVSITGQGPKYEATSKNNSQKGPIVLVQAIVTLSSRMMVKIPIFCDPVMD